MTRKPLSRQAELSLRQYILDEGLAPGDALPSEAELAERLNMGKTSLREGVRRLETLGIVDVRHGRGLFVGRFSFAPLIEQLPYSLAMDSAPFRDLLQARRALEEGLVVQASRSLTETDLAHLDSLVEQMADLGPGGMVRPEVDREFHHALFAPLGNQFVSQLQEVFWQIFARAMAHVPPRPDLHTVADHARIVEAIRSGDPLLMTAAVAAHFADIEQVVADMVVTADSTRRHTQPR
ncbi:FadR/GntR family transcriptional regulator [Sanguibacter sp. A247]|uniref:FadR/GntR family transcriptional regulator n=1 Tax=unclassified Sanguibacter TaxID=2645534 RepID=UPI003FD8C30B